MEFVLSPTERKETVKNLVIPTVMSMFAVLSQKSDESEEQIGKGGSLTPVVGAVLDVGMMNCGDVGCGGAGDLHEEEEDVLKSQ